MKFRGTRSTIAVVTTLVMAALILTALVAVIGSAQAAPSNKNYNVTVRLKSTSPSTVLTITLTNDRSSKQTLGSAQFTAPVNMTPSNPTVTSPATGWQASVLPGTQIVQLVSTTALKPGDSLTTDVTVTTAGCTNATWGAAAKQSNDFSGSGNDFALGSSSTNLRPLGTLAFVNPSVAADPAIGTHVDNPATTNVVEQLFVPQIAIPAPPADVKVAAKDVCNASYPNYGRIFGATATLKRADPDTLTNATIPSIVWSATTTGNAVGTGTTTLDPATGQVETGDQLVLDDDSTTIEAGSNVFDVVDKICTVFDTICHWDNGNNKIHVDAAPPTGGASLGIGFIDDDGFSCGGSSSALGQTLIYANPRDYGPNTGQSVSYTYDKTLPGTTGNVANFEFCYSKDGADGTWIGPMDDCAHSPPLISDAPCVQDRTRVQGNFVVTLFFDPHADPLHGGR